MVKIMIDARRLNKKIKNLDNCSTVQDKILYSWSLKTESLLLNRIIKDYNYCFVTIKCHNECLDHHNDLIIPFEKLDKIYSLPSQFLDEYIKLLWSNGYVVSFDGDDKITDVDDFSIVPDGSTTVKEYSKSIALKLTW